MRYVFPGKAVFLTNKQINRYRIGCYSLQNGYQQCLLKKRDRCLQVLFDHGYNEFNIRGMNPYHVLFQYASGYNSHLNRHENLYATVSCLLRKGGYLH